MYCYNFLFLCLDGVHYEEQHKNKLLLKYCYNFIFLCLDGVHY